MKYISSGGKATVWLGDSHTNGHTHTHSQGGGSCLKSFFYRLTASIMTITRRTIKGIATARSKLGGEKSRPQSLNVSNCRQGIWHGICAQISACSWLIFKAARIFMLDYKFPARLDLLQAISFSPPAQPPLAIKVRILLPFFFPHCPE